MKQKELHPLERQTLAQMYRFHPKNQVRKRAHCLLLLEEDYSLAEVSKIMRHSIDSQVAIACIDDFCNQRAQRPASLPAYLIIDNTPIHNSKAFRNKEKQWQEKGLIVKRIPAYCPELNLIEILRRKIKYECLCFHAYQTFDTLVQEVDEVISGVGKHFVINFD